MLEQMYWACSECLTLATQLSTAHDLPAPQVLRQRISVLLDNMVTKGRELGVPQPDLEDAKYALVAFIDEQILLSQWAGRQQWLAQQLQYIYYQQNTAGEGFFLKLKALEQTPGKAHVLEIYYLCLALGFQGKYAVQGTGDIAAVQEQVAALLYRQLPASDEISLHGYPRDNVSSLVKNRTSLLLPAFALLGISVALFVILKIFAGVQASDSADQIRRAAPTTLPAVSILTPGSERRGG
jgi:type VI secretion system protein ImpK